MKIRKVIIPAAGFGTRFLPATKATPKEMLPVVDKPIIQIVVEEAVEAGIEDVIIVTGSHKRPIEDHFDYPFELEQLLIKSKKEKELEEVRRIASMANFIYLRQKGPIGNATPILNARSLVENEPFLVLWGDDFIVAQPSRTKQLIEAYNKYQVTMLGAMRTTRDEDKTRYGYASGTKLDDNVMQVKKIIEKPGVSYKESNLATISGFIFTPEILDAIEEVQRTKKEDRELMYIDALNVLLKQNVKICTCEIRNGVYYDTGNKLEYLKTVVQFALNHKELNGEFRKYLRDLDL